MDSDTKTVIAMIAAGLLAIFIFNHTEPKDKYKQHINLPSIQPYPDSHWTKDSSFVNGFTDMHGDTYETSDGFILSR